MAGFNYNLKDPSSSKPTPIRLMIRWNKEKIPYSIGEKIHPKYWHPERGNNEYWCYPLNQFSDLNYRLKVFKGKAEKTFRNWLNDHDEQFPTSSQLKNELDLAFDRTKKETFYEFFDSQISKMEVKPSTRSAYQQTFHLLKKLFPRLSFGDFDIKFETKLTDSMKVYGLNSNSRGKHIKHLKRILGFADRLSLLKDRSYQYYIQEREDKAKIYLSDAELLLMYQLDLEDILDRSRKLFLLGALTGLRFSDFNNLQEENIRDGYLIITQQKTGDDVTIPMHPIVAEILRGGIPHPMTNQHLNRNLKLIGQKFLTDNVSVKGRGTKPKWEFLTTHTARCSFAQNAVNSGLFKTYAEIMFLTGHKTERAFLTYLPEPPRLNVEFTRQRMTEKHEELIRKTMKVS